MSRDKNTNKGANKTKKTTLYIIICGILAVLFAREYTHAQREHEAKQQIAQLEYEIDDIKADYYNDGFNACQEQF